MLGIIPVLYFQRKNDVYSEMIYTHSDKNKIIKSYCNMFRSALFLQRALYIVYCTI